MAKRKFYPLERFIDPCGIKVYRCCASCKFKQYNTETTRLCLKGCGIVSPQDPPCEMYEYITFIKDPSRVGKGEIKKRTYFRYLEENYGRVKDYLTAENISSGKKPTAPSSIEVINAVRKEYETKFGVSYYFKL